MCAKEGGSMENDLFGTKRPLEIMHNVSDLFSTISHSLEHFAIDIGKGKPRFDWEKMKAFRDDYISKLNEIYEEDMKSSGVEIMSGVSRE